MDEKEHSIRFINSSYDTLFRIPDGGTVSTNSGVRCALKAFISNGISISSKNVSAFSKTGRSDVLPIITLTKGFIF